MTIYDKIIWFMLGKAAEVKKFCDIEYFTDADAQAIYEMDEKKLETTWRMIKNWINFDCGGLTDTTCPFCIYYKDNYENVHCDKCEYGKNHGVCGEENSDWGKMIKNDSNEPSHEFYKNLIDKIETDDFSGNVDKRIT